MWSILIGMLGVAIPNIVWTIVKLLGLSLVTYSGIDLLIQGIDTLIFNHLNSLGFGIYQLLKLLNIDQAVNIIVSAVTARAVLAGVSAGRRVVFGV